MKGIIFTLIHTKKEKVNFLYGESDSVSFQFRCVDEAPKMKEKRGKIASDAQERVAEEIISS